MINAMGQCNGIIVNGDVNSLSKIATERILEVGGVANREIDFGFGSCRVDDKARDNSSAEFRG